MVKHNILFFGCITVTLSEVRFIEPVPFQKVENGDELQFRVRASVSPKNNNVLERFGECVDSDHHAMQSVTLMEDLLLPVMLERVGPLDDASCVAVDANSAESVKDSKVCPFKITEEEALGAQLELEFYIVHNLASSLVTRRSVVVESLLSVAGANCGVATMRVGAAALNRCELWGQSEVSLPPCSPTESDGGEKEDRIIVELQFIVRAHDMSAPVRVMQAAEQEAHALFRTPEQMHHTTFFLPAQPLPYGVLPLDALYHYYRLFYERIFNRALHPSEHVLKVMRRAHSGGNEHRWNALEMVDFRPVLLGEDGLAPVLATLFHCPSLSTLVLDENRVGDITCFRLTTLLHKHRCLQSLTLCGNDIYETGAEQLLRLVRRNKRITELSLAGNPCSTRVMQRLHKVLKMNQQMLENDPFNIFSPQYAYTVSPSSFSTSIVNKSIAVWTMLTACPLTSAKLVDEEECLSIIPRCALSPLLNEVARTVSRRMSFVQRDPWIRMVFSDIESFWEVKKNKDNKGSVKELVNDLPLVDVEELYRCSFLHLIVTTMRSLVQMSDWADALKILHDIGRRQKAIGIVAEDYRDATQIFVQSLTTVCGKDASDAEHAAAFLQCLALGVKAAASA